MCAWGGPTGINEDMVMPPEPVVLRHYGSGTVIRDVAPGRTLVALGMPEPEEVWAVGVAIFGDSGSPVISDDGRAVGVVFAFGESTRIDVSELWATWGDVGIVRLAPRLSRAEEVLEMSLTLVTAQRAT